MVSWHRLLPVRMIMRGVGGLEDVDCSSASVHSCNTQSSRGSGFFTAAGCLTGEAAESVASALRQKTSIFLLDAFGMVCTGVL